MILRMAKWRAEFQAQQETEIDCARPMKSRKLETSTIKELKRTMEDESIGDIDATVDSRYRR